MLHVRRTQSPLPYEGGLGWVLIDIEKLRSSEVEEKYILLRQTKVYTTALSFPLRVSPHPGLPPREGELHVRRAHCPSLLREGWGGCLLRFRSLEVEEKYKKREKRTRKEFFLNIVSIVLIPKK